MHRQTNTHTHKQQHTAHNLGLMIITKTEKHQPLRRLPAKRLERLSAARLRRIMGVDLIIWIIYCGMRIKPISRRMCVVYTVVVCLYIISVFMGVWVSVGDVGMNDGDGGTRCEWFKLLILFIAGQNTRLLERAVIAREWYRRGNDDVCAVVNAMRGRGWRAHRKTCDRSDSIC